MAHDSAPVLGLDPRPKQRNFITKGLHKMTGKTQKATAKPALSADKPTPKTAEQPQNFTVDIAKDNFQAIGYDTVSDLSEPTRMKMLPYRGPSLVSLVSESGSMSSHNSPKRPSSSSDNHSTRGNLEKQHIFQLQLLIRGTYPSYDSPEMEPHDSAAFDLYPASANGSIASFGSLDPKISRIHALLPNMVTGSSECLQSEPIAHHAAHAASSLLPTLEMSALGPPYLKFTKTTSGENSKPRLPNLRRDVTTGLPDSAAGKKSQANSTLHSFETVNANINSMPEPHIVDALFKKLLASRVFPQQAFQSISHKRKWELLLSENETNPEFDLSNLTSQISVNQKQAQPPNSPAFQSQEARLTTIPKRSSSGLLNRSASFTRSIGSSLMGDQSHSELGTLGALSKRLRINEGTPSWYVSRIMANKLTLKEYRKLMKRLESKGSRTWLYEFQDAQGVTALSVILQRINKRSIKSNDDILREQYICHALKLLLSTDRRVSEGDTSRVFKSDDEASIESRASAKAEILVIGAIMHSLLSPSSTTRLLVTELLVYLIHSSKLDYFPHIMEGFIALQDAMGDYVKFQPWLNVFETAIDQHFNLTASQRSSNELNFKNYVLTTLILINLIIHTCDTINDRVFTRKDLIDSRLPIIFDKLEAMKDENIKQQIQEYEISENSEYSEFMTHQMGDYEEEKEIHTLGDLYSKLKIGPEDHYSRAVAHQDPASVHVNSIVKRLARLEYSRPPKEAQKVFVLIEAILDHTLSDSNISFDPDSVVCISVERLMDRMETDEMARRAVMETVMLRKTIEDLKAAQPSYSNLIGSGNDHRFSAMSHVAEISKDKLEIERLRREKEELATMIRLKRQELSEVEKIPKSTPLKHLEEEKTPDEPLPKVDALSRHLVVDELALQNRSNDQVSGMSTTEQPHPGICESTESFKGAETANSNATKVERNENSISAEISSNIEQELECDVENAEPACSYGGSTATVDLSTSAVHTMKESLVFSRKSRQSLLKPEFKELTHQKRALEDHQLASSITPPPPLPAFLREFNQASPEPKVETDFSAAAPQKSDIAGAAPPFSTSRRPLPPPPPPPLPLMLAQRFKTSEQSLPPPPPPLPSLLTNDLKHSEELNAPPRPPPPPPPLPSLSMVNDAHSRLKGMKLIDAFDTDESSVRRTGVEILHGASSEKQIKPKTKLKQMHWNKIENIDRTFWNNIPNKEIIDDLHLKGVLQELEKAFVAKTSVIRVKTKADHRSAKGAQKVSLLPRDLAQQFGINLHMFGNLTVDELMDKILRCDPSITENVSVLEFFNSEALNEVPDSVTRAFLPYTQDYSRPENTPLESSESLERADRIFLEIFNMRKYWKSRSRALLILHSFKKDSSDLLQKLDMVHRGASCIQLSENLKQVLALIRSVGNFMNDSSKQAMGFKIDILQRLRFMKDDSNSLTFLHYVEKIVRNNFAEFGSFVDELSILNHTQRIAIEQLEADCVEFKNNISNVATSLTKGNLSESCHFHPKDRILEEIKTPLEKAKQKVFLVDTKKERTFALYCEVMDYFGENSSDSHSKNSFFGKFSNFVLEFKKVHTENVQKEEDERVYEQKKQMIERKENVLKAQRTNVNRLTRLKYGNREERGKPGLCEVLNSNDDEDVYEGDEGDAYVYSEGEDEKENTSPESIDELLRRLKYQSPILGDNKLRRNPKGLSYAGLRSLYSYSIENFIAAEDDLVLRREKSSNEYESVKTLRRRMTTRKKAMEPTAQEARPEQFDVVMLRAQAMLSQLRAKTIRKSKIENDEATKLESASSRLDELVASKCISHSPAEKYNV